MNPFYFHVTNLLLHCAVTCLLMYTCECCVFEDGLLAFVTALIFAVHPIHTEAVSNTHAHTQLSLTFRLGNDPVNSNIYIAT